MKGNSYGLVFLLAEKQVRPVTATQEKGTAMSSQTAAAQLAFAQSTPAAEQTGSASGGGASPNSPASAPKRDDSQRSGPTPGGAAPDDPQSGDPDDELKAYEFVNTNIWSTRELVTMALMCTIGVLLTFIEFPIFPGATWLKYDASAVPAMICGFAYGPSAGLAVGIIGAILHGLIMADFSGAVMNILVVIGFVWPAAMVYKRWHTYRGAVVGLVLSVLAAIAMAILGNLIVTPLYLGVPLSAVIEMIVPILLPFNALKGALNAVLTLLVYKAISNLITPKKDQVKGR